MRKTVPMLIDKPFRIALQEVGYSTSINRPGRVWRPNWMKITWRQSKMVLIYRIVEGEKKAEEKELSQIRPRKMRSITVKIKLRKYRNLTLTFGSKNVIMIMTISFTLWITNGRLYPLESSLWHGSGSFKKVSVLLWLAMLACKVGALIVSSLFSSELSIWMMNLVM